MSGKPEEIASKQIESATSLGATTTNIALVLFAALLVSFAGMWEHVGRYRNAAASQQWFTKHKQLAELADLPLIRERVKGALTQTAFEIGHETRLQLGTPKQANQSGNPKGDVCSRFKKDEYFTEKPTLQEPVNDKLSDAELRKRKQQVSDDQRDQLLCLADRIAPVTSGLINGSEALKTTRLVRPCPISETGSSGIAALDPYQVLEGLQKHRDWRAPYLESAISRELALLRGTRDIASRRLHFNRAVAEKTSFKLFGLDFSVDGFWAWNIWFLLFVGGVVHLWLVRRAILRRCRLAWMFESTSVLEVTADPTESAKSTEEGNATDSPASLVCRNQPAINACSQANRSAQEPVRAEAANSDKSSGESEAASGTPTVRQSFPIWLRPLPSGEPWVTATTNRIRLDIATDPLSLLALVLMWVCFTISIIAVIRLSIVSCSLLNGPGKFGFDAIFHAIICCLLSGVVLAALVDWYLPLKRKVASAIEAESRDELPIISRRAWAIAALSCTGMILMYRNPMNSWIVQSLLTRPRFNKATGARGARKRRRKVENIELKEGFYEDRRGQIHYVPPKRCVRAHVDTCNHQNVVAISRARSLAGIPSDELIRWTGPFDESRLRDVHPSALLPFVRTAVESELKGFRHRTDLLERTKLLRSPDVQKRYKEAFNLTKAAIYLSEGRRRDRSKMPNLQLYDLLAAISTNCQSTIFLRSSRSLLASAKLQTTKPLGHASTAPMAGGDPQRAKHNRHLKRKSTAPSSCRRAARLNGFRSQRLGKTTPYANVISKDALRPPAAQRTTLSGDRRLTVREGALLGRSWFNKGTWNTKYVSAEAANQIHFVRMREKRHRARQILRKTVVQCG